MVLFPSFSDINGSIGAGGKQRTGYESQKNEGGNFGNNGFHTTPLYFNPS
jgi:hypothetical protein